MSTATETLKAEPNAEVSEIELVSIVFQALRKVSGNYDEAAVNNSPELRKVILTKIRDLCKEWYPEITDAQWDQANKSLGRRLMD